MDGQDWTALAATLGEEPLAELLGVGPAALDALSAGEAVAAGGDASSTGEVQARGAFLRMLVADLARTRDPEGVRRWFRQRQRALGGGTPAGLTRSVNDADSPQARQLRALAATPDPLPRSSRDRRRMLDLVRFEHGEPERRDIWRSRRT